MTARNAAKVSQILAAVRSFLAERGALPSQSGDWDDARSGDRRYPCWATVRRAGFRSMEDLADALGTTVGGVQWGRTRVLAGLRRYADERGPIPAGSERWYTATRGEYQFPGYYHILKFYPSMEAACRAAGVPSDGLHRGWTIDEETTLRHLAGTVTRADLVRALPRHTENAIKRRLYDLGLMCRTAQGLWTLRRLAAGLQMLYHHVQWLVTKGAIPVTRISRYAYTDPADLPDWLAILAGAELRGAVLARRRQRIVGLVEHRAVQRANVEALS